MAGIFTEDLYQKVTKMSWYERLLLKFVWLRCTVDIETDDEIVFVYHKRLFDKLYILNVVRKKMR